MTEKQCEMHIHGPKGALHGGKGRAHGDKGAPFGSLCNQSGVLHEKRTRYTTKFKLQQIADYMKLKSDGHRDAKAQICKKIWPEVAADKKRLQQRKRMFSEW